jgi:hypothetical protein
MPDLEPLPQDVLEEWGLGGEDQDEEYKSVSVDEDELPVAVHLPAGMSLILPRVTRLVLRLLRCQVAVLPGWCLRTR